MLKWGWLNTEAGEFLPDHGDVRERALRREAADVRSSPRKVELFDEISFFLNSHMRTVERTEDAPIMQPDGRCNLDSTQEQVYYVLTRRKERVYHARGLRRQRAAALESEWTLTMVVKRLTLGDRIRSGMPIRLYPRYAFF